MDNGTLEDLTNQTVWSEITEAYKQVITQTSFYRSFMEDICKEVLANAEQLRQSKNKKRIRVLDAGCGIGYLVNKLSEDQDMHIIGIDTNAYMLDMARKDIGDKKRVKLVQADASTFASKKPFDIIVSTNLLFNLKQPFDFLANCYNILTKDGHLVLSSASDNPDLQLMVEKAKREFESQGICKDKYIEIVRQLNQKMMDTYFRTFSLEKISDYLSNFCGFSIVNGGTTFSNQNFLINAKKEPEGKIIIDLESGPNAYAEAWKLKHFILSEVMGLMPTDKKVENTKYDSSSELLTARDSKTNKLLGFQNMIKDSEIGLPCEETISITQFREKFSKIVSFAGTYVVPRMNGKRLGAFLMSYAGKLFAERGFDAGIAEANPQIMPFAKKMGFKPYHSGGVTSSGLKKIDVIMDMQASKENLDELFKKAHHLLEPKNITLNS